MAIYQHCKSCGAQLVATAEICPFCKAVLKEPEPETRPKRKRPRGDREPIKGVYGTGHRSPGLARFVTPKTMAGVIVIAIGCTYLYSLIPEVKSTDPPITTRRPAPTPLILPSTIRTTDTWYKGGSLSNASLATWGRASYRNRLATAADVAAVYWMGKLRSMDALKPKAVAVERCISVVATAPSVEAMTVRAAAAACVGRLGWRR